MDIPQTETLKITYFLQMLAKKHSSPKCWHHISNIFTFFSSFVKFDIVDISKIILSSKSHVLKVVCPQSRLSSKSSVLKVVCPQSRVLKVVSSKSSVLMSHSHLLFHPTSKLILSRDSLDNARSNIR